MAVDTVTIRNYTFLKCELYLKQFILRLISYRDNYRQLFGCWYGQWSYHWRSPQRTSDIFSLSTYKNLYVAIVVCIKTSGITAFFASRNNLDIDRCFEEASMFLVSFSGCLLNLTKYDKVQNFESWTWYFGFKFKYSTFYIL